MSYRCYYLFSFYLYNLPGYFPSQILPHPLRALRAGFAAKLQDQNHAASLIQADNNKRPKKYGAANPARSARHKFWEPKFIKGGETQWH
jgi:hypothetical protein